jgi:hypothetical protein
MIPPSMGLHVSSCRGNSGEEQATEDCVVSMAAQNGIEERNGFVGKLDTHMREVNSY